MAKLDLETHVCDAVRWTAITQALLVNMGETTTAILETSARRTEFWERFAEVRLAIDRLERDVVEIKELFYADD